MPRVVLLASLLCLGIGLTSDLRASDPPFACFDAWLLPTPAPGPIARALGSCTISNDPLCKKVRKISSPPGFPCRESRGCRTTELSCLWEISPFETSTLQFDFDKLNGTIPLRTGGRFLFEPDDLLGVVANIDYFGDQQISQRNDDRMLADVNATVTWARTEWGHMRTGVGIRWHKDGGQNDLGYNVHCGGDLLSLEPFTLSTSLDAGSVGESNFFRVRSSVDLIPNRLEAFGGYERLSIGRTGMRGPLIGVKVSY